MLESRRSLIKAATATAAALLAGPIASGQERKSEQPLPSPNAPTNQNVPAGMNPEIVKQDKPSPNPLNQEQIAKLVQELYTLAGELKDEVDHTDLRSTFPLDFVKRAQQIEKLAKHIKEMAKG
jgi:hypothetical protein